VGEALWFTYQLLFRQEGPGSSLLRNEVLLIRSVIQMVRRCPVWSVNNCWIATGPFAQQPHPAY